MNKIPHNKPLVIGNETDYIKEIIDNDQFAGNGQMTKKCNKFLENRTDSIRSILTPSCTDALEMTALLCGIEPGDEVIMPSFTFVSTASAFALRKANIIWCDIRQDTKNIDETKLEELITSRTKAVVVVHYAGIACEMDVISDICFRNNILLIEDAAQAIGCYYKDRHLGGIGDFGTLSFHETKNIQCGEGGALLVNNSDFAERAEFIRDKGTNRTHFDKGFVDKYTWVELGSSFLMSELQAAFLKAQLDELDKVNAVRLKSWNLYYKLLSEFIPAKKLPYIPEHCRHNGHMFYFLTDSYGERTDLVQFLAGKGISAIFHYIPLHEAPFWKGKYDGLILENTDRISKSLLRLPMFFELSEEEIVYICGSIKEFYVR